MKHSFSSSTFRNPSILILCTVVLFFLVICGLPASSGTVNSLTVEASNPPVTEPSAAAPASSNAIAAMFAPVITATKTASPSALVNPGGTITYTVTIGNTSMDATGVNFSDTIDANTTLVAGSLKASPVAVNDSYTAIGNVRIQVPAANGVLANDFLGLNPLATITAFDATSVQGGNVTVAADGSFTYNPPAGYEGTDTFNYTLTNTTGSNSGTVTITISGMIWFINNNAPSCLTLAAGCGRLTNPFSTLAAFAALNNGTGNNPAANDNIFIYTGATDYNAVLTLLAGQRLIGQGAGATLAAITGLTPPAFSDPLPATGGTRPNITSSGVAITLGSGNTIRGLNVGNTTTTDIAGTSFGTLMIGELDLNGTGQALNLTTGTLNGLGVATATFTTITSTNSPGGGISLTSVAGGLTATTTSITNPGTIGINVNTSSATLNFGNTTVNGSGGTGVSLTTNTGTLTFADLDIAPDANQRGLLATDNTLTLTITTGTIINSGAVAVQITKASGTSPLQVSLTSVSANGGTNGIIVTNATGSFTVTGDGNTSVGGNSSGGTIQNTTSHAIQLTNMTNPSFTNLNIQSIGRSGVDGQQVTNFTFKNSTINNVGTAAAGQYEESNIAFNDGGAFTSSSLSGTASITQNVLTNARRHGIQIENGTGTISNLTISNNTLTSSTNSTVSLGTAILALIQGSAATTAHLTTGTITANTITNFPSGEGIAILGGSGNAGNNTSGTLGANGTPINITNNSISGQAAAASHLGSNAIRGSFNGQVGVSNFNITGNTPITNIQGQGISVFMGGTVTGTTTISNNSIVANQTLGAGTQGLAVQVDDGPAGLGTSAADYNIIITNNSVSNYEGNGIRAIARASLGKLDVTIQNNTVGTPTLPNRNGIRVDSGSAAGDVTLCMNMTGNTSDGSGANAGIGIRKQGTVATTNDFGIVGLAPSPATAAQAAAKVVADNPAGGGVDVINGDNFVSCGITAGPIMAEAMKMDEALKTETTEPSPALSRDDVLKIPNGAVRTRDEIQKLKQSELDWLIPAAIERWRQSGIAVEELEKLQTVKFELADLADGEIARVEGEVVKIDDLAAGYGWFVDLTIFDDNEFMVGVPERELQTTNQSLAHGRVDLLTVVMRGLGVEYLKGKTKVPKKLRPLMETTLSPSVRRVPNAATIGFVIPEATNDAGNAQPNDSASGGTSTTNQTNSQPQTAQNATAAPQSGETVNVGPIATLPAGESVIITFQVTVNAVGSLPVGTTQVCNQGTVSGSNFSNVLTDDPAVAGTANPTCTSLNVADVAITKSAGTSPVCSTSNITFTLNYINNGPAAAVNALVSDVMPAGTNLVSVTTPATWTRSDSTAVGANGTITFTKASSANADTATFTIVVSIAGSVANDAVIQNQATVSSATADTTPANNTSNQTSTTVKLPPTTATVGGPQTICALGTTTGLGGNTPTIGTGTWTVQSGGTGTFTPNATTPNATFTHLTGTGPVILRWTISNPPCADSFAEVTVTVKAQPTATVGGPQTICALGTTAGLGGNTPAGGATGTWSIVTAGVTGTFTPTATTPNATFTHLTGGIGTTITLRWTVSNAPCTDATADVAITIKSQPTATVGGPQTICAGGTTAGLGGNTPAAGETGTWSIVTAGITGTFNPTANTPNATFTHATGATTPFVLRWTVTNAPCTPATADVSITLQPAPIATVGGPQTICELGTTAGLGGNTPAAGETGTWSIVTAGVTGTFTPNANAPNATFTHTSGAAGSNFTLRWTVNNATCGQSAQADVVITVRLQPTATVGGPQTICALGTTAGLGGNTPAGGATGMWSIVTGGATGTFNPTATTPNATFTHLTGTGVITLRWTVSNAPCTAATADVLVTITQPPTTATVGGNQTICALSTTAGLGGNTPTVGTGTWTVQSGGTGTFSPNANTGNATFTHTGGTGPIVLRWTISNPPCPNSFAQVTITITQSPSPATVGGPQTICALSTTAGLGGNTPASGTGLWTIQSGGTGTFSPSANTPNATFTHTGGTGPIVLRWTIANAPCPDSFAEVTITITQAPTPATVGANQTICALSTTAGLGGNTPTVGTGTWSVQSGGTGTFSPNANTGNATFTHTGGAGPIVLRWTIANAPCPASFAEVTITITQSPTPATVGANQTICALSTTAGLGGNTPTNGTGTWTVQSGGTGTFSPNANTGNATFTHTGGTGPIVLRWTISNPPCPDSFAQVTITITPQPTATAGGPQTICALGTTAGLGGNTPTGGATGMWSIVTGGATGTFNPTATTPNATFTHLTGTGMITLRWTVSNPPCGSVMADVIITITQPPTTATAGGDQIIPPGGTTAGLGGNTPVVGTGMWTIVTAGVTGTFNPNATTPNATWTHATGSGMVVLRWTISNPPCPDSFDEVTIQIGIPPTITCPANITQSTDPGVCQAVVNFTVNSTGLPTPTVTCTPPSGSVFPKGTTTVNCTAANGVPPDASCSFTVTINDTEPPMITCPANVTVSTDPNVCSAVVNYPAPTVTDNCPPPSGSVVPKKKKNQPNGGVGGFVPTCTPASGSTFAKGTTTVNCTVSDASGNTAMCSFTVTVNDTQPPAITCPANVTVSTDPNLCSAVVNYPAPTVSDNCPGVGTPSCTPPAGSAFPKGTTTVNCTVVDASGNTANCSFTVTVNDTQKPTITCPANITATIPSGSCVVVNYPPPTVTDNCPGVTVNCVPPSGSCFSLGVTTVTCTAIDASGNTKSCSFTVTTFDVCIQDDGNPAIVLLFNSTTGQYVFCCDGTVFTGTGTVKKKGSLITLNHNPPDRRLTANVTLGGTGQATLQSPPGTLRCVITDRDVTNNTCNCSIPIN